MSRLILAGLMCAAGHASAVPRTAVDEAEYLRGAKGLIQAFLDREATEYGVDLHPDPTTWTVHYPYLDMAMDAFALTHPFYFVGADGLVNSLCRSVTVELPARAALARFYVVREAADQYRLVGSCRDRKDPAPRMRLEALSLRTRPFPKREFAARAIPLVQNYFRLNGITGQPDWASTRVRRGRGWWSELTESPTSDCRIFDVPVNGARVRTYVAIQVDETRFLPDVPLALQSLLKDPATLRTYRFAVVKGCGEDDQRRAPPLNPPDPGA